MSERVVDWEKKFNDAVQHHYDAPFEWGVSDCYMIVNDCVKAITGSDLFPNVKYKTEKGAAKELLKRNFKTVEDALNMKFSKISAASAKRGDIGVVENDNGVAGGVFTSLGFMTKGEKSGMMILPFTAVKTAFKV